MAYDMGLHTFNSWYNWKNAMKDKDYQKAYNIMKDSDWCRKDESRCERDAKIIKVCG